MQIFKVYQQKKEAIDNWATTFWSNLKPNLLLEGIEGYISDFEQLDKWVG